MNKSSQKKGFVSRRNLLSGAAALGGMVVGAVVGIMVQAGVESTGLLGPSVEALIAEQESNFDEIGARLESLRGLSPDPAIATGLTELGRLLARQDELQRRSAQELTLLNRQVTSLRQQSLEEHGYAGGADLWLGTGESISVGDSQHVFGVVRTWSTAVDINVNGEKSRLKVGDAVTVPTANGDCTVFFKQALRKEDSRSGFDVACG